MVRKRDLPNGDSVVWPQCTAPPQAQMGVETVTHRVGQEGAAGFPSLPFPSQQPYCCPASPGLWPPTPAREGPVEERLGPEEAPESKKQETRQPRLSGGRNLSSVCLSPTARAPSQEPGQGMGRRWAGRRPSSLGPHWEGFYVHHEAIGPFCPVRPKALGPHLDAAFVALYCNDPPHCTHQMQ